MWTEIKIVNGKLKEKFQHKEGGMSYDKGGFWDDYNGEEPIAFYQPCKEDVWQLPVSLNKVLFLDRVVKSTYSDNCDELKTLIIINQNDRYFIKTHDPNTKEIHIREQEDKRYVEILEVLYNEFSHLFTFTKKGNQWHLDKQEPIEK